MIIARLKGGLGNQMFQYAAGLALARRHGTALKLDLSWFGSQPGLAAHNRYALSCFALSPEFATPADLAALEPRMPVGFARWTSAALRRLGLARVPVSRWYRTEAPCEPADLARLPDDTGLDGYFQSEEHFATVADLVRARFSFAPTASPVVADWIARIRSRPSVAVHVRRGDYASNPVYTREHGLLGAEYYRRAMEIVRKFSPDAVAYVFSDEPESAARELSSVGNLVCVTGLAAEPDHESLRLMSLCDHQIIANSSFSWWAAWLNSNPAKRVVAPEPWFANPAVDARRLVPSAWLRLAR